MPRPELTRQAAGRRRWPPPPAPGRQASVPQPGSGKDWWWHPGACTLQWLGKSFGKQESEWNAFSATAESPLSPMHVLQPGRSHTSHTSPSLSQKAVCTTRPPPRLGPEIRGAPVGVDFPTVGRGRQPAQLGRHFLRPNYCGQAPWRPGQRQ